MPIPDPAPARQGALHIRFVYILLHAVIAGLSPRVVAQDSATLGLDARQVRELGIAWHEIRPAEHLRIDGLTAEIMLPIDRATAVAAPFAGRVTRVLVDESDAVTAGQVLAHIASREYAGARARLDKAVTQHALARARLARDEALLAEGIAPLARVERSRAELRTLVTEVAAARAMLSGLESAGAAPGTYALQTGVAGHIVERRVLAGEPIAGFQVAFVVAEDTSLRAEVRVSHLDAAGVKRGDVVRLGNVTAPVTGRGAMVDPATQTVRIFARVPPDSGLLPGQRVEAVLESAAPPATWELPRTALAHREGGTAVYVIAGEHVKVVPVEPVSTSHDTVIVRGPLNAGERVVVNGVSALKAQESE